MPFRCGFAKDHPADGEHHETAAQVALCSRQHYAAQAEAAQDDSDAEIAVELAYERHLEDAGADEARLQDEMERRQGVIPFDEALRQAQASPNRARVDGGRVDWKAIAAIPVGGRGSAHYALVIDGETKFYLVERSDSGKWAGRTVAKVQAGPAYHRLEKGAQIGVLGRIAADPRAAAKLYAQEVGQCSQCNSPLTDDESRARGMGPVCAGRFGGAA